MRDHVKGVGKIFKLAAMGSCSEVLAATNCSERVAITGKGGCLGVADGPAMGPRGEAELA